MCTGIIGLLSFLWRERHLERAQPACGHRVVQGLAPSIQGIRRPDELLQEVVSKSRHKDAVADVALMPDGGIAADEAAYIVTDCGARVLITSSALTHLAEALVSRTPGIELRLALGTDPVDGHTSFDQFVDHEGAHADRAHLPHGGSHRWKDLRDWRL